MSEPTKSDQQPSLAQAIANNNSSSNNLSPSPASLPPPQSSPLQPPSIPPLPATNEKSTAEFANSLPDKPISPPIPSNPFSTNIEPNNDSLDPMPPTLPPNDKKLDNLPPSNLPPPPPPTNISSSPSNLQPVSPPSKNKKGPIIFVMLFFLLLVLGLAGFYSYKSNILSKLGLTPDNNKTSIETPEVAESISVTPIPTLAPTPIPTATIPRGWLIYNNNDCGFSIAYPPKWTSKSNCMGDEQANDCLISDNFSGTPLNTGSIIKQGILITIQCQPTTKTIANTNDILTSCQQTNADLSKTNTCQQLDTDNQQFIITEAGKYQTIAGNYQYTIKVEPAPPTTFRLLKEIIKTFQVKIPSLKEKTTTEILPNLDSVIEDSSSSVVPN